jgi:hypothetical protein
MANTPQDLHGLAVAAEKNLEQIATGLGQAGAPPAVIKTVTQMAEACRQLMKGLAGAAQASPPPPAAGQPPATIDSATNDMTAQLRAKRQGGVNAPA